MESLKTIKKPNLWQKRRATAMSQILYNIKQAFVQIGRNKAMSLASVFAITAMMLILGLFFVITVNINLLLKW